MITAEQIEFVLNKIPPRNQEKAGGLSEDELQSRIDNALVLVMDWLAMVVDPVTDTDGLLQRYQRTVTAALSSDTSGSRVESIESDIVKNKLNHFAFEILGNLLRWVREKDGITLESQQNVRWELDDSGDLIEIDFLPLTQFMNKAIFSNTIVTNHPQAFEFFRVLSYAEGGIESFEELDLVLNQIHEDKLIEMIDSVNPGCLGWMLTLCQVPPNTARSATVNRMITNAATRSGSTRLEVATHLANRGGSCYDLFKAQFDIIKECVVDDGANFRETLSSLGDAISAAHLLSTNNRILGRGAYDTCSALREINSLLLSQPGRERQSWLSACQRTANGMTGHANATWRALGIAMLALGSIVAALGMIPIISTGAVPIGLGILVTGLGIFAHNRQKGDSMIMQKLHDDIKNRPDISFVSI